MFTAVGRALMAVVIVFGVAGLQAGEAVARGATSYTYDPLGRVASVTYANGDEVSYTYDAAGNRTQLTATSATPLPVVSAKSISTAYNTAGSVDLAPSGSWTSVAVASGPTKGTVSIAPATSVATYTPTPGTSGSDTFTFTATGRGGTSAPATVSVTVVAPAPTVSAKSIVTAYNTAGSVNLAPSGVWTSIAFPTSPTKGTLSRSDSTVTYTPTAGTYGSDSFTFTATGPGGTSTPATVRVTVANSSAPTASVKSVSMAYNTAGTVDLAPSGSWTSVAVASGPTKGTVFIAPATSVATYTPTAGTYGSDSFTFTATGAGGTSAPAMVNVTVGLPPAPTASDATLGVAYNSAVSLALPVAGVVSSIVIDASPAKGTLSVTGTSVTYTATWPNYGADSFTYHATGPGGPSPTRTVTVTIGNGAAPIANNGSTSTAYNTPVAVTYSVGGDYASPALDSAPAHGSLLAMGFTPNVGWQQIYTPQAGYYGVDSWVFHGASPFGNSPARTFSVSVAAPPTPTASVSSPYWTGYRDDYGGTVTDPVVCSASGGTPGYSFHWEKTDGDSVFYASNPDGDTTDFIRDSNDTGYFGASWRCRVTDAAGAVTYSPTVTSVWNYVFNR